MGQSFCRTAVGLLTPVPPARAATTGPAAHAPAASRSHDASARDAASRRPLPSPHTALSISSQRRRTSHARGVTLLELLVALTILGILAAAAAPNFKSFLHNSRLASEATKLFLDVELARSEAARRNATVTICPMDSGNACSADWNKPRVIFVDADADGSRGVTEELIRNSDALASTVTVTAANLGTTTNLVRIRSSGISSAPTASWKFCESNSTQAGQTVSLTGSGRPHTDQQSTCP